jgi:hypothetical protein
MHSTSILRGESFQIATAGRPAAYDEFFADFARTRRLGIVAPGHIDGAGTISLVMAYVTAFYDQYRADGGDFFVYPDFFAFVPDGGSMPSYGGFDIWPNRKVVAAGPQPIDTLRAVTDRAVNILFVPDGDAKDNSYDDIVLGSARRTIDTCYAYAFDGRPRDADVTVSCPANPMLDWVRYLFDSVPDDGGLGARKAAWLDRHAQGDQLTQCFRRIELDQALRLL